MYNGRFKFQLVHPLTMFDHQQKAGLLRVDKLTMLAVDNSTFRLNRYWCLFDNVVILLILLCIINTRLMDKNHIHKTMSFSKWSESFKEKLSNESI